MKKRVLLIALATLVPLAGCVAPYGYYDRGYYGESYGPGYRGYGGGDAYYSYNQGYAEHRYAPWGDYNPDYDDGYDD
jgi:hypothetical protein